MFLAFFTFLKFLFNNTGSLIKRQPALSKSEWQKKLTPEQFHVTREKGTEPVSYTCLQFLSRCVGCGAGQTGVDLTTKPNLVLFSQITPPSPSHMYKESQWEFDVWSRARKAIALGQPGGVWGVWGGLRREGTHVCLWPMHVDVW